MDFIFRKGTECIFLMDSLLKNQEKLGNIKMALKKGFRIYWTLEKELVWKNYF